MESFLEAWAILIVTVEDIEKTFSSKLLTTLFLRQIFKPDHALALVVLVEP